MSCSIFFQGIFAFLQLQDKRRINPDGWVAWVCGLGAVSTSLAFGLVRGAGAFSVVLPSLDLVSRMPFAQDNHGFDHFFIATSSS